MSIFYVLCLCNSINDAIIPLLEQCGFGYVVRLRKCMLDAHLITAMVLRWRPDMHTFQLPSGECTITLQDVNMLLDLQISGQAVSGRNDSVWEQFPRLLGVNPPERKHGYSIRTAWLKEQLSSMPPNPNEEQAMQQLRMYLLYFFGKFLVPDKSGDRIHTMYLPLLEDIPTIRSYSWGSACLASLYRGLCDATTPSKRGNSVSGCVLLLQAWARSRIIMFQRERVIAPPFDRPLALKWVAIGTRYQGDPAHNLVAANIMLDHIEPSGFIWTPYDISQTLYPVDVECWSATTYLINFGIVEYHQTDRVRLQFGLNHVARDDAQIMEHYHEIDMRKNVHDWAAKFHAEIQHWNHRNIRALHRDLADVVPLMHSNEYLHQYTRDYMPYVSDNYYLNDPRPRPDMPPQYANSPHSYTQQQQQYTNIPYTQQQQQETCIPDPPPFTQQQQPFTQHTMSFTESDFMTPQQLTRNFFGYDRADFESPGTRQFNENYSNYFPPGEFTQPQQTQQVSQDLPWTELSGNYLNSTWTQAQGSTSAFGQPAPRNEGINFLGVPDNNPNEDDGDVEIFGVGLRARTRPPCGTGGCL
ncbi:unnamed protein product [Trifolium pratense]|uniref:Uncharacterized protein n=1 Tax=Trifolium pratense TaxID=57577 RepID=A0ACB0LLW0_TRIPR|nr:unnamed protein product [Trifolium pratense]